MRAVQGDIPLEVWALHATGKCFRGRVGVSHVAEDKRVFTPLTFARYISREKAAAEALVCQ